MIEEKNLDRKNLDDRSSPASFVDKAMGKKSTIPIHVSSDAFNGYRSH